MGASPCGLNNIIVKAGSIIWLLSLLHSQVRYLASEPKVVQPELKLAAQCRMFLSLVAAEHIVLTLPPPSCPHPDKIEFYGKDNCWWWLISVWKACPYRKQTKKRNHNQSNLYSCIKDLKINLKLTRMQKYAITWEMYYPKSILEEWLKLCKRLLAAALHNA